MTNVDLAVTAWQPVASPDGQPVAFVLEPRLVHRKEYGVFVVGWETMLAGASLLVDASGTPIAELATGLTTVVTGASRAWVLQQDLAWWEDELYYEKPPSTPLVHGTVVDRDTFDVIAQAALTPPIETPVALGDDLVDVSAKGHSDVARDIFIRRRNDDGTATPIYQGRGFGSAWCARADVVALAYATEDRPTDVRIVSVRRSAGSLAYQEHTIVGVRLDARDLACDASAERIALGVFSLSDQLTHVLVVDGATGMLVFDAPGHQAPMALSADRGDLIAVRSVDSVLVRVGPSSSVDVGAAANKDTVAATAGDFALFHLDTGLCGIALSKNTMCQPIEGGSFTAAAWPAGDSFVMAGIHRRYGTSPDDLLSLSLIGPDGQQDMSLPPMLTDPTLTRPIGSSLYLSARADIQSEAHVFGYDLTTRSQVSEAVLPECDEQLVLGGVGCR